MVTARNKHSENGRRKWWDFGLETHIRAYCPATQVSGIPPLHKNQDRPISLMARRSCIRTLPPAVSLGLEGPDVWILWTRYTTQLLARRVAVVGVHDSGSDDGCS